MYPGIGISVYFVIFDIHFGFTCECLCCHFPHHYVCVFLVNRAFSRLLLEKKVAVVVVGYPATPINLSRVRFCMSTHHSKEELDLAIDAISVVGDQLNLKLAKDYIQAR